MKEVVLVLMLVGLVVLSGIQAVQITDLKEDFTTGNVVTSNVVNGVQSPTQQVRTAAQPTMVGGC
jgi:hypothetical protein